MLSFNPISYGVSDSYRIKRAPRHLRLVQVHLCMELYLLLAVNYYLISLCFKFHWGDIALFVTLYNLEVEILAQVVGVPVDRRSGGWMATTIVATINIIIFFLFSLFPRFFPPSFTFLIEGVLGSKNLVCESWPERPKIMGYTLS